MELLCQAAVSKEIEDRNVEREEGRRPAIAPTKATGIDTILIIERELRVALGAEATLVVASTY